MPQILSPMVSGESIAVVVLAHLKILLPATPPFCDHYRGTQFMDGRERGYSKLNQIPDSITHQPLGIRNDLHLQRATKATELKC